eukprot:2622589-Amphidinium_carterae.3
MDTLFALTIPFQRPSAAQRLKTGEPCNAGRVQYCDTASRRSNVAGRFFCLRACECAEQPEDRLPPTPPCETSVWGTSERNH